MKNPLSRRSVGALLAAPVLIACHSGVAFAQAAYPQGDITMIVPYSPGASGDTVSRKYAALLSAELGVTVVIDNAPGGSGTIGTVKILGSQPDGYTIGYGHNSPLALQPHSNAGLPYKNVDDFATIGGIGHQSGTVSVNSAAAWQTFDEMVEAAKAAPGTISIAVGGAGNVKDLQLQQFQKAAGVEFNIVPFSGGGAEAVVAVLGQIVDGVSVNASSVTGQVASGDIRPLAIFAKSDKAEIGGFEVITEAKYPGLQYLQDSSGIIVPKGVPEDIIAILAAAHQKVMQNPEFVAGLEADSFIVDPVDPAGYREQLLADYANFGAILGK